MRAYNSMINIIIRSKHIFAENNKTEILFGLTFQSLSSKSEYVIRK